MKCEVTLENNVHSILDTFDPHEADNPNSDWTDAVGRFLREVGQGPGAPRPQLRQRHQDFSITITWDSDDVTLFVDDGVPLSGADGANAWPFTTN